MAPRADTFDMIKVVVREVIREELDFEVEKGVDKDFNTTYTIHLTMNGERTGKYLCMQLTPGYCDEDSYELEIV